MDFAKDIITVLLKTNDCRDRYNAIKKFYEEQIRDKLTAHNKKENHLEPDTKWLCAAPLVEELAKCNIKTDVILEIKTHEAKKYFARPIPDDFIAGYNLCLKNDSVNQALESWNISRNNDNAKAIALLLAIAKVWNFDVDICRKELMPIFDEISSVYMQEYWGSIHKALNEYGMTDAIKKVGTKSEASARDLYDGPVCLAPTDYYYVLVDTYSIDANSDTDKYTKADVHRVLMWYKEVSSFVDGDK